MTPIDPQARTSRGALIITVFALVIGGGCLTSLFMLTGAALLAVPIILLGVGLFAGFHYFLWGRSFAKETDHERQEIQILDNQALDEWDRPYSR